MDNTVLKTKINSLYDSAIKKMENHCSIEVARDSLLEVVTIMNEYAKLDAVKQTLIAPKIEKLLKCCEDIRISKSYNSAYKILTNKSLNFDSKEHEKIVKKEAEVKEESKENIYDYQYNWDNLPVTTFDDVAGLIEVKEQVRKKVLYPLMHPEMYDGYDKENGGGLLLYGLPGTGKTMIAAAIANEINAKFCSIGPSDLLSNGVGNSEKAIARLFDEARSFKCAIIFFDEIESLAPVSTHAQHARQIRSELLRQMQGLDSYDKKTNKVLFLIAATNKPWDIDPAFVRPGRFGTRIYVDLPDYEARKYIITNKLDKIAKMGKVAISSDIDIDSITARTEGFNGSDVAYLLNEVQEISIDRISNTGNKMILNQDFEQALSKVTSSVNKADQEKLNEWRLGNI